MDRLGGVNFIVFYILNEHIRRLKIVPEELKKQLGLNETVNVTFRIDKDGKVQNPKGDHQNPLLNKEAERVISRLLKWIPAAHLGQEIDCMNVLPIRFFVRDHRKM